MMCKCFELNLHVHVGGCLLAASIFISVGILVPRIGGVTVSRDSYDINIRLAGRDILDSSIYSYRKGRIEITMCHILTHKAATKWPPFARRYSQMYIRE